MTREQARSSRQFVETRAVSHELALRCIEIAIAEGASTGLPVSVAVVDPALGLVGYVRADGTTPHSSETSLRKARTSASTRRATGWMQGDLAIALPLGTGDLLTNIRGGVPIRMGGVHLGGLGVAGGTPDRDAEIAHAVLEVIGAEAVDAGA